MGDAGLSDVFTPELVVVLLGVGIILVRLYLWKPEWGLAVGLAALYNPYFNYLFLFTQEWRGGFVRGLMSLFIIMTISMAVLIRHSLQKRPYKIRTPFGRWLIIWSVFPVMGFFNGLLLRNDLRLLLSDLFPIVEFYSFFFLACLTIRSKEQASRLVWILISAGAVTSLVEIIMYNTSGYTFVSKFAYLGTGITPGRMDDFMPSLLFPLVVGIMLQSKSKKATVLLCSYGGVFLAVLLLGFFRSLWVGVLGSILFMFWKMGKGIYAALGKGLLILLLLGVGLLTLDWAIDAREISSGISGVDLIVGRLAYIEDTSGWYRIEQNAGVLAAILQSPLFGKGFGGTFFVDGDEFALFSCPNYYLSLAAQLGVPAILLLAFGGVRIFKLFSAKLRTVPDPFDKGVFLGCLGSFAATALSILSFPSLLHYPIPAFLAV